MKKMSKQEFLSFLYEEKNRIIQNNNSPGWSLWALQGLILSAFLYAYNLILSNTINVEKLMIAITILLPTFLCIFHLFLFRRNFFKQRKAIRLLYSEGTLLFYLVSFILTLIGSIFYNLFFTTNIIGDALWLLMCTIHLYVTLYILANKKKLVYHLTYFDISNKMSINFSIYFFSILIYYSIGRILSISCDTSVISKEEWELSYIVWFIIILVCLIYRVSSLNKRVVDLDNLISQYIIGEITNEEVFENYIQIVFGKDVFFVCNDQIKTLSKYIERCEESIKKINLINQDICQIKINIDNYFNFQREVDREWELIGEIMEISEESERIIDDLSQIDRFRYSKEVIDIVKKLHETNKLTMQTAINLGQLLKNVGQNLNDYIKTIYCSTEHKICLNEDCDYRNIKLSQKNKMKLWFYKIRYRLIQVFHKHDK